VEVVSAAPKGPRLGDMIDGLSQVGAASWSPLDSARGVVEPGAAKLGRLERIAAEAAKQCGRAWRLEIGAGLRFEDSLGGGNVVLADALGAPYKASGQGTVRVLVGPEGGWDPRELDAARRAGVRIARFGPHAMRIETATVAAAAVILDVEGRG
jgi:16S rRNA (uracil1498-N3)-methyltransferase